MTKNKFFGKLPETKAEQPKVVETEATIEAPANTELQYSKSALSIYKNSKTRRFNLVRVTYDPDTHTAGNVELIEESVDRGLMEEKFKLLVVREIFANKENE